MLEQIKKYLENREEENEMQDIADSELTEKEKLVKAKELIVRNIEGLNNLRNETDSTIAKLKKAKTELSDKIRRY